MKKLFAHASRRDLVVVGALIPLLLLLASSLAASRRTASLYVVNGFDKPIVVDTDGRSVEVPGGQHLRVYVAAGVHEVKARTQEGTPIEDSVLYADPSADAVLYNPLGAAPIYSGNVTYSSSASQRPKDDAIKFHGGERHVVLRSVDYPFQEPPKSIKTESKSGSLTKSVLGIANGGWMATAFQMGRNGNGAAGSALLKDVVVVEHESPVVLHIAARLAHETYGDGAVTITMAQLLAASTQAEPYEVERALVADSCQHRTCADGLALISALRPSDSVQAKLLALRTLPEAEVSPRMKELLAANPGSVDVARLAGRLAYVEQRWADCVDLYASAVKAPDAAYDVDDYATCLHEAGRGGDALDVLGNVAKAPASPSSFGAAVAYARIATKMGDKSPMKYLALRHGERKDNSTVADVYDKLWAATLETTDKVSWRDDVGDPSTVWMRDQLDLALAALTGADKVAEAVSKGLPMLKEIPDALAVALGAEIARAGDLGLARRVFSAVSTRYALSFEATLAYIFGGVEPPLMYRVEPEHRAALELVRARRLDELGRPSQALYASARKRDVLGGWPSRLMGAWLPPRPSNVIVYREARETAASKRP